MVVAVRAPARMRRRWERAALALGVIMLTPTVTVACVGSGPVSPTGPAASSSAPSSSPTPFTPSAPPHASEADVVASGLKSPWSVAFHGQAALVSERDSGRVLEVREGADPRVVATIDGVKSAGEGGLLGLAVRGDELYAYLTTANDNRILRFEITGSPGALSLGPARVVIEGLPSGTNHNGGRIAFGPDGKLYATVGDAGNPSAAQDGKALGGKILRLEPDGSVPEDNPFRGSPVFSLGHRNPQGIGWTSNGTMYASEFGQDTWDELNVITAAANYGWPTAEGRAERTGFADPVRQWAPSEASPSGLLVRDNDVLIAALRGQRLLVAPMEASQAPLAAWVGEAGRLRDVVRAPDGSIWVLTNNTDGRGTPGADDDRILRFHD